VRRASTSIRISSVNRRTPGRFALLQAFAAIGFDMIAEDITNKGRIDLTVKTDDSIYIIEFKVDSDEPAIHQIKERGYCDKYLSENKQIFMIGINFSSTEKNITDFQWERVASNI